MKFSFLFLMFLLPTIVFSQKSFEITLDTELTNQGGFLIEDHQENSEIVVILYAPNFREGLMFESAQGWVRNKSPRYDEIRENWILFLPINKNNEIRLKFPGYYDGKIIIQHSSSLQSKLFYNVYERDKNSPPLLIIQSNPANASFKVESSTTQKILKQGMTSLESFVVPADSVKISVEKENFLKIDTTLTLKNGIDYPFQFKLDSAIKFVEINTSPPDAKLFLNDKEEKNPFRGYLPLGSYYLTLRSDLYQDLNTTLNLTKGGPSLVHNYSMQLKLGKVTLPISVVSGANVYFDDIRFPVKNGVIENVSYGNHTIKVLKKNYHLFTKEFSVTKDNEILTTDFFNLEKDEGKVKENSKKAVKNLSLALGLGGVGVGLLMMQSANQNYEAYNKSTNPTEAASLRSQVETADRMAPILLGVGGLLISIKLFF